MLWKVFHSVENSGMASRVPFQVSRLLPVTFRSEEKQYAWDDREIRCPDESFLAIPHPAERTMDYSLYATNSKHTVRDLVWPVFQESGTLIVTGYQDLLSALAFLMEARPGIADESPASVRIVFGTNTTNAHDMGGREIPLSEEARTYFLGTDGLSLRDSSELRAALARKAVMSGAISLRMFNAERCREEFGKTFRKHHAKLFVSDARVISGSANLSLGGLMENLEFVDDASKSPELELNRRKYAERFWNCGRDWTKEALEIIERLLSAVSPQEAVARATTDMRGYRPWRVENSEGPTGRDPLPFQADLVYEAAATIYECGFAFVEAPAGSGKTDIGKHLGAILPDLHTSTVMPDRGVPPGQTPSTTVALVPPNVVPGWQRSKRTDLHLMKHSDLSKGRKTERQIQINRDIKMSASMIIDESHNLNARWRPSATSTRARTLERCPALWTACLSATLAGNHDIDSLLIFHERRAAIYATPETVKRINAELLQIRNQHQFPLFREPVEVDGNGQSPNDHDERIRQLAEILAGCTVSRRRNCIGEKTSGGGFGYPDIDITLAEASLNKTQRQKISTIIEILNSIPEGSVVKSGEERRTGPSTTAYHGKNKVDKWKLRAVMRSSMTYALCMMEDPREESVGFHLRQAERFRIEPGFLFNEAEMGSPASKCDEIIELLKHASLAGLDRKRAQQMAQMVREHGKVLLLAEDIGVLEVYARLLREETEPGTEIVLVSSGKMDSDLKSFGINHVGKGFKAENYLGVNAPDNGRPMAMFMTVKMGEGLNLQQAQALGIIGTTSDVKSLLQGMGRIDRIDSPHHRITYWMFDTKELALSSDRKGEERVRNLLLLAGAKQVLQCESEGQVWEFDLRRIIDVHKTPRFLRDSNLWDILESIRQEIPENTLNDIRRAAPESLWGAHLCFLESETPVTIAVLGGREPKGPMRDAYPPRLIAIGQGKDGPETVWNQVTAARLLRDAWNRTRQAGLHLVRPNLDTASAIIEDAHRAISALRHWDIRPDRTVSLLWSLDLFVSGACNNSGVCWCRKSGECRSDRGKSAFGHLPLPALERLAESWTREIDPTWKKMIDTHHRAGTGSLPEYCGVLGENGIFAHFLRERTDEEINAARERMTGLIERITQDTAGYDMGITDRIAVLFCGHGTNDNTRIRS